MTIELVQTSMEWAIVTFMPHQLLGDQRVSPGEPEDLSAVVHFSGPKIGTPFSRPGTQNRTLKIKNPYRTCRQNRHPLYVEMNSGTRRRAHRGHD